MNNGAQHQEGNIKQQGPCLRSLPSLSSNLLTALVEFQQLGHKCPQLPLYSSYSQDQFEALSCQHLAKYAEKCFLQHSYKRTEPLPSSWVPMSLLHGITEHCCPRSPIFQASQSYLRTFDRTLGWGIGLSQGRATQTYI